MRDLWRLARTQRKRVLYFVSLPQEFFISGAFIVLFHSYWCKAHCVCVCVWVKGTWRIIRCYWCSFQCDGVVETEIQAQVGSDLRLSYGACHHEECALRLLWLDAVFLFRGNSDLLWDCQTVIFRNFLRQQWIIEFGFSFFLFFFIGSIPLCKFAS